MANYEKFHIADFVIDDEQLGNNGREISVFVDTLEMVSIEIGSSLTIRTNDQGLEALRHVLHDASCKLDVVRHQNLKEEAALASAEKSTDEKSSESQGQAGWEPDDPVNW